MEPTAPPKLYPELPSEDGRSYRLQRICEVQKRLETERDSRAALHKKYRRGVNALEGVDTALVTAGIGLGASGVGLLSTISAAPVVVTLEIAALACGLTGMAGKVISRRLALKAKKHDEIRVLAEAKLDTISDHVSQALRDGSVSDDEFRLILDEMEKYSQMKGKIRTQTQSTAQLDEAAKNELIRRGHEEARASLLQKLSQ